MLYTFNKEWTFWLCIHILYFQYRTFWLCSSPIIPFQVFVALSKLPYFPSSTYSQLSFFMFSPFFCQSLHSQLSFFYVFSIFFAKPWLGCDFQQKWSLLTKRAKYTLRPFLLKITTIHGIGFQRLSTETAPYPQTNSTV